MPIVLGIDGTGAFFDSDYAKDFAKSFVRTICPDGNHQKKYFRGPIGPGGGLVDAVNGGFNFVKNKYEQVHDKRILLTGYSRGGLGVLVVADKLRILNIPVTAMLLFDSVDRHVAFDMPVVPNNVGEVLHLRRNPLSGSRGSFGNCGTQAVSPTRYGEQFFVCTHGGMGGTFWQRGEHQPDEKIFEGFPDNKMTNITYREDERVSGLVWKSAQGFISRYNFI